MPVDWSDDEGTIDWDVVEQQAHASKVHSVPAGGSAIRDAQSVQPTTKSAVDGEQAAAERALGGDPGTARCAHAGPMAVTSDLEIASGQPSWTRGGLRHSQSAGTQQPRPAAAASSAPAQSPLSAFAQIGGTLPLRPYSPWPETPTAQSHQQAQQRHAAESFTSSPPVAAASAAAGSLRRSAPAVLPSPSTVPRPGGEAQHARRSPHGQQSHGQQRQMLQPKHQAQQPCSALPLPPPDRRPATTAQPHARQEQQPQQRQRSNLGQRQQSQQQAAVQHLRAKMAEFREIAPHLPPPPPSHVKCPGVYGKNSGCGGTLEWVRYNIPHQQSSNVQDAQGFWGCSNVKAECDYRESVPARHLSPQLAFEIISPTTFEMVAAPGAEDVLRHCGGLRTVLTAVGFDFRLALPQHGRSPSDAAQPRQQRSAVRVDAAHMTAEVAGAGSEVAALRETSNDRKTTKVSAAPNSASAELSGAASGAAMVTRDAAAEPVPGPAPQQTAQPAAAPATDSLLFWLEDYEQVRDAVGRGGQLALSLLGNRWGLIPSATLAAYRGKGPERVAEEEVNRRYARMPASLAAALLPFQREGVCYAISRRGRCLIADEMGVGKTLQAIAFASCYQEVWPLLVVVPAAMRLVWAEELERWLPADLRPAHLHVVESKADRLQGTDNLPRVVVTSYDMLHRLTCEPCKTNNMAACTGSQHCMAAMGWRVLVADESHTLRTTKRPPDALHTEALAATARRAAHTVFLSGTPSLNRPFDLFRQVDLLREGLLGRTRDDFAHRYCARRLVPVRGSRGAAGARFYDDSGLARGRELHGLLKQEVMLRRLKREVMAQLPAKRRQVVRLPRPRPSDWPPAEYPSEEEPSDSEDEAAAEDAEVDGEAAAAAGDGQRGRSKERKGMSAAHRTGVAKIPNVVEWLALVLGLSGKGSIGTQAAGADSTAQGQKQDEDGCGLDSTAAAGGDAPPKVLIFAHHKGVMTKLAGALEDADGGAGIPFIRIDGSTDSRDRLLMVQRFRNEPALRVALLSVTAAGTGLDFSAASLVVFAELPSEGAVVRQAEDRAHRQGQKLPVNVYFLCAKGTSDDRRWEALNRSLQRVDVVHDNHAGTGAGLPLDKVLDLQRDRRTGGLCTDRAVLATPPLALRPVPPPSTARPDAIAAPQSEAGAAVSVAGPVSLPPAAAAAAAGPEAADMLRTADSQGHGPQAGRQEPVAKSTALSSQPLECDSMASASLATAAPARHPASPPTTSQSQQVTPPGFATQPEVISLMSDSDVEQATAAAAATGSAGTAAALRAAQAAVDDEATMPGVWFEVSEHTTRVHFHGAGDGTRPLGASLPLEALLPACQPSAAAATLLAAVEAREEGRKPEANGAFALDPSVGPQRLRAILASACDFAAEWAELRSVFQSRLYGCVLRSPLQEEVDRIMARAEAGGALGVGTERYATGPPADALPEGAALRPVRVHYARLHKDVEYQQAFTAEGQRLCLVCLAPVASCPHPPDALLPGAMDLFCGLECETKYGLARGGGAIRRALFRLERGVCVKCGADCHALVQRLQGIEKGARNWEERRRSIIARLAPRFLERGYKALLDRLARAAVAGNAWNADHIVPVFRGGGACGLENLRTLCTPCHADVTKQQARERAAERLTRQQGTLDAFVKKPPRPARPPMKRMYASTEDDPDDDLLVSLTPATKQSPPPPLPARPPKRQQTLPLLVRGSTQPRSQ